MLSVRLAKSLALLMLVLPLCSRAADFGFDQVIEQAKKLASEPYTAPTPVPKFMQELSYPAYQNIRFDPQHSMWREGDSNFQVMFIPPGLYYTHSVKISVIDAEGIHPLNFDKSKFVFTDPELQKRIPADLGYAGFKLTYPLKAKDQDNQFLVFAGASYFRGVGRDNNFGLSARGLAINTGLPSGEKFPSFIEYWLVRPAANAEQMMVYGLLDGEYGSGAYQFTINPGKATELNVKAVLFPRKNVELLGVAPLTSMFFYGENTTRPAGEWRPQVHDSDGLLIHNGASGEWLWRPLLNPERLEMDYFQTENVRGFGLLQRDSKFENYEDLEAQYQTRPSTWVQPEGDWGKGEVVLVQLPSEQETNDNMVAFWHPAAPVEGGAEYRFNYKLSFGPPTMPVHKLGKVVNTFTGHGDRIGGGDVKGAYRFIVDFSGDKLNELPSNAPVIAQVTALEQAEVIEQFVEYNTPCKCWRLSILARAKQGNSLALRAFLTKEKETLTETWNYRLPPDNDLQLARD